MEFCDRYKVYFAFACSLSSLSFPALGAEVGPVTRFSPDSSHTLELKMTAAAKDIEIGGYKVAKNASLVVCDKSGANCADPYAGAVLQLNPRDKLVIDLENKLNGNGLAAMDHCMVMPGGNPNEYASDRSLLNLHTHGLLVSPSASQANGKTTFGDNIFSCTSSQVKGGSVVGSKMHYEITLQDTAPGQAHPLGIDWIHPHVHGIAKAQVSSGMASMIIVGDINRELCAQPSADQPAQPARCTTTIPTSAVKHLMLKDAQLVIPATQADGIDLYTNYADQNPDFCGSNKFSSINIGECAADPTTLQDSAVKSGRWVFTVNGVKAPHWAVEEDRYEVWRVQNGSANVTYHLSLQALAYGSSIVAKAPFHVLDMDGAGLVPGTSPGTTLPTTTDILLMPGSRADLLVQAPNENRTDVTYALVNDNFQTGYVASDADVWPHIQLATVTFKASRQSVDARTPAGLARTAEFEAVMKKPSVDEGKLAQDLSQQCAGLGDTTLTDQERQFYHDHLHAGAPWKRRIYFGVYDQTNTFALGDTLIDGSGNEFDKFGRPITPTNKVKLSTFAMNDSRTGLCIRKDAQDETWELVNVSNEVHNFHIHQTKFGVVRIAAGPHTGEPVMRTPSPIDAVDLPGKLLFKTGVADLQHDTIVVPRGQSGCTDSLRSIDDQHFEIDRANPKNACDGTGSATDISGMIQVRLNFNGNQMAAYDDGSGKLRHAKFVYHCHILEHEDKGMMAGITVIDPDVYR